LESFFERSEVGSSFVFKTILETRVGIPTNLCNAKNTTSAQCHIRPKSHQIQCHIYQYHIYPIHLPNATFIQCHIYPMPHLSNATFIQCHIYPKPHLSKGLLLIRRMMVCQTAVCRKPKCGVSANHHACFGEPPFGKLARPLSKATFIQCHISTIVTSVQLSHYQSISESKPKK
jgi:hypothetical protein